MIAITTHHIITILPQHQLGINPMHVVTVFLIK